MESAYKMMNEKIAANQQEEKHYTALFKLVDDKFDWYEKNYKMARQHEKDVTGVPAAKSKAKAAGKAKTVARKGKASKKK